jgi:hypothetical protein
VTPARGALRLGRAAVLGACCLLLSLSAHVLAGGAAPSAPALLVLAVPVACLSILVTGERAGLLRIGGTLAAAQVGLHEGFMLLAQPHCSLPAMAGHAHGAPAGAAMSCTAAMPMAGPSVAMVVAHVAAAAATGLLLWQGERLIWALVTWLAVTLPQALDPLPARARRTAHPIVVRRSARSLTTLGGVGRRGPPAVAAA